MNVTEFKKIVAALSTYASARATDGPTSRIGVQVSGGKLKLIAGSSRGGIVVQSGTSTIEDCAFFVDSKPLLAAARVIKGKLDIGIGADQAGLYITTSKGGSIDLGIAGSLKDSGFARKPKRFEATAHLGEDQFSQVSRLFNAVGQDIESQTPTMHYYDGKVVLTGVSAGSHSVYASLEVPGDAQEEAYGSAYMDFFASLRVCEARGAISFGKWGASATSGDIECFSAPYLVSPYDKKTKTSSVPVSPKPWPTLGWRDESTTARATLERKVLIEAVKTYADSDEHKRVTLQIKNGLRVYTFGSEQWGTTIPANSEGDGVRSVQANYLLDMLRAFESKEVALAWGKSPAIRLSSEGYNGWIILLSPTALS